MDARLRSWIVDVLEQHRPLLAVAVRQRAKFEGWLKFELAAYAELQGARDVEVETSGSGATSAHSRFDITFSYDRTKYDIELKTPNTNWQMPGVLNATRPITNNVAGIVEDAKKLLDSLGQGIIAFAMFPVPLGDSRWTDYLDLIGKRLSIALSEAEHSARVNVLLADGHQTEIVVVTFSVPHRPDWERELRGAAEPLTGASAPSARLRS